MIVSAFCSDPASFELGSSVAPLTTRAPFASYYVVSRRLVAGLPAVGFRVHSHLHAA